MDKHDKESPKRLNNKDSWDYPDNLSPEDIDFDEIFAAFGSPLKKRAPANEERPKPKRESAETRRRRELAELERRHPIEKYVLVKDYGIVRLPACSYKGTDYPYLYIVEMQDVTFGNIGRRIYNITLENKFDIVDLQYSTTLGYNTQGSIVIGARLSGIGSGEIASSEKLLYNAIVVFAPRGYY